MMAEHKIFFIGCNGVGKSAMLIQLINCHFVDEYDPTIEDSYRKQVSVDYEICLVDMYDYAHSQENTDYSVLREAYMKSSQGFILVYSITDRSTFKKIRYFYDEIVKAQPQGTPPMILVGNKTDLNEVREVTTQEGNRLALGVSFMETTAKNCHDIENILFTMVREIRFYLGHTVFPKLVKHLFIGDIGSGVERLTAKLSGSIERPRSVSYTWKLKKHLVAYRNTIPLQSAIPQFEYVYLCFSLVNRMSFEGVHKWIDYARKYIPNAKIYLVGTRSDSREFFSKIFTNHDTLAYDNLSVLPIDILKLIFSFVPNFQNLMLTCKRIAYFLAMEKAFEQRSSLLLPVVSKKEGETLSKEIPNCQGYFELSLESSMPIKLDAIVESHKKKKKFFFF